MVGYFGHPKSQSPPSVDVYKEKNGDKTMKKKNKEGGMWLLSEKPRFLAVVIAGVVACALLITVFSGATENSFLCSLGSPISYFSRTASDPTQLQLAAILHYATSRTVPQQTVHEIRVSFDVIGQASPCNFLVFGLGHDSLMWSSFNARGTTVFLEEDPKWVQIVLKDAPMLRAHHVQYRTQLSQADELLKHYKSEPDCLPPKIYLKGNERCRLALTGLPDEIYNTEWDLIMIDAPRGYFAEAPGRMGAIFSAAVMAMNRKKDGVTHVFLHDVDRRVEKSFAEEFLCAKNRVKAVGRLWHFEIPSARNQSRSSNEFC